MKLPIDWTDKYKPKSLKEVVGNRNAKDKLNNFLTSGDFPHILLHGPPGVGKTTSALIFSSLTEAEVKPWNAGQIRRGAEQVREEIVNFASTRSIDKPFKIAILDEFDQFSDQVQAILRAVMDRHSQNCKFILISNVPQDLNVWIRSRVCPIEYNPLSPQDILDGLRLIVGAENLDEIISEKQAFRVAEICCGDMRKAIKLLQGLCQGRTFALSDNEIELCNEGIRISDIEQAVTFALHGNLSEAIETISEIPDSRLNIEKVLDILLELLIQSEFSEEQKITICIALSKIDPNKCSKFQVYGILALIARETKKSTIVD